MLIGMVVIGEYGNGYSLQFPKKDFAVLKDLKEYYGYDIMYAAMDTEVKEDGKKYDFSSSKIITHDAAIYKNVNFEELNHKLAWSEDEFNEFISEFITILKTNHRHYDGFMFLLSARGTVINANQNSPSIIDSTGQIIASLDDLRGIFSAFRIKTYQSKQVLQNEKGLEKYIDEILSEKATKGK